MAKEEMLPMAIIGRTGYLGSYMFKCQKVCFVQFIDSLKVKVIQAVYFTDQ